MSQNRQFSRDNSSDYQKGYYDGQHDAFAASELDAYYAGVGYAKHEHGDKHLGFTNANERRQFEKGMENKDHHFGAYRVKPLSFWERIFGRKDNAPRMDYTTRKQAKKSRKKAKKQQNRANRATRKASRKTNRQNRRTRKKRH